MCPPNLLGPGGNRWKIAWPLDDSRSPWSMSPSSARLGEVSSVDIQKVVHEVLPKGYSERIETGNDASGSPAIWVWVIAPDKAKLDKATIVDISDQIHKAVREHDERWPYVLLRRASEERTIARSPTSDRRQKTER